MQRRRLAHLLLVLAGIAMMVAGGWSAANPSVDCRGVEMHPGDVCHKNDFSEMNSAEVQTYEQRMHSARISQPVIIVLGAAVTAFGSALLVQEGRRREQTTA